MAASTELGPWGWGKEWVDIWYPGILRQGEGGFHCYGLTGNHKSFVFATTKVLLLVMEMNW